MATIIGLEKGESSMSVVLEKVQSIDAAELSGVTGAFNKLRTLGRHIKGATDELDKSLRHAVPIMATPSPNKNEAVPHSPAVPHGCKFAIVGRG